MRRFVVVLAAACAAALGLYLTRAPEAAPASPAMSSTSVESSVQWHRGISAHELNAAKVVRVPHGFHLGDLAALRDDQMIETPAGHRIAVGRLRTIQSVLAKVRSRPRASEGFRILPRPTKPCTPPKPGETFDQLLARPDGDVVCLGKHNTAVSVAQLRLMKPFVERMRGRSAAPAIVGRAELSGPATTITDAKQLQTLLRTRLKDAPDSTVLVNPKGQRVRLGSVRAALRAKPDLIVHPIPPANPGR